MKKIAIAVLAMAVSAPSFADQQVVDGIIGAVVGGGGARALYKGNDNRKRNMITAAGALGGMWVGSKIGDDSERRHQENLQAQYDNGPRAYSYDNRQVQPMSAGNYAVSRPVYSRSARYDAPSIPREEFRDDDVDVNVQVNVPQAATTISYRDSGYRGCDGGGYTDPEAARAYCAGRAAHIRQAYERGVRGR